LQQRDAATFGRECRDDAGGAGGGELLTIPHRGCFGGTEPARWKEGAQYFGHTGETEVLAQFLQGARTSEGKGAHPLAPQPDQVPPGAQGRPQIASKSTDVGARGTTDPCLDIGDRSAVASPARARRTDVELVDGHRPRGQVHLLPRADATVSTLPVDLDGA